MRWLSAGLIRAAAFGAAAASSACSACGPRAPRSACRRSRTPGGGGGRSSSSASAARRYRPVPPTTIGVAPSASRPSISAWASAAYSATEKRASTGRNEIEAVLEARPLLRIRDAGEDLQAPVDLQRVGRDGDRAPAAGADPLGERDRHVGLADPGRAEEGEHLGGHEISMGRLPPASIVRRR